MSADASDEPRQLPAPALQGRARHRRQGTVSAPGAEVNMALMRRLVEAAAASGDVRAAAEAVRVCMAEAENLYQLAMSERDNALALVRQAAEEQARARHLHEEATRAFEETRARRERAVPGSPAHDVPGCDLRPDPSGARSSAELLEALRQFRTWAGNPSYRDMERACNGRPVASTMCRVLGRGRLPARFEVIDAIITACGGEEEDRERFASAWRRLIMPGREARPMPGRVRAFPGTRRTPRSAPGMPGGSPA
ncbi:MAG: hypothetical protein JWO75_1822 [Actinomycetia bacterium]|nr:hypothetical protein [Actinomycetes bacterium]